MHLDNSNIRMKTLRFPVKLTSVTVCQFKLSAAFKFKGANEVTNQYSFPILTVSGTHIAWPGNNIPFHGLEKMLHRPNLPNCHLAAQKETEKSFPSHFSKKKKKKPGL